MKTTFRPMVPEDWPAVAEMYRQGIESAGIWTLRAGIFPENAASIRIFKMAGFDILGTHERLGRFHDGRWRDVVLMERRSRVTGGD